ncbi:MAG: hypothetical protein MUE36_10455 [Acidimicrobiales bacterium]|nr:hypothetical protein [Acidimicrobiales bacterium]
MDQVAATTFVPVAYMGLILIVALAAYILRDVKRGNRSSRDGRILLAVLATLGAIAVVSIVISLVA